MNIAQLEEKLTNAIDKSGFVKIQFDKPKISRYLTVEFSVQDTQDREEAKSIKALKKLVDTTLFTTNWRLMSPGFEYRLGFLSGQLKGFSLDEDLLKLHKKYGKRNSSDLNNMQFNLLFMNELPIILKELFSLKIWGCGFESLYL